MQCNQEKHITLAEFLTLTLFIILNIYDDSMFLKFSKTNKKSNLYYIQKNLMMTLDSKFWNLNTDCELEPWIHSYIMKGM